MYYLLLSDLQARTAFIDKLKSKGIHTVFHYIPLHTSPYGQKAGRAAGLLPVTVEVSDTLVRLPLWLGMEDQLAETIEVIKETALA